MENAASLLSNTNSIIAIIIGVIIIVICVLKYLSNKNVNIKNGKVNITNEEAIQSNKAFTTDCIEACYDIASSFASDYIEKYKEDKYKILYILQLVLSKVDSMLRYNNISMSDEYIEMRFVSIKAIVDEHRIKGGSYNDDFYKDLKEAFIRMIKQIIAIKKHYAEE